MLMSWVIWNNKSINQWNFCLHCSVQHLTVDSSLQWLQKWVDCEIFQSESNPDLKKLNPIQSWPAKCLKIISLIQSWPAYVMFYILPHEAKALLEPFCLQPNTIGWRRNSSCSAFASWSKTDTAFCHIQYLTRQCILPSEAEAFLELFCH